jgi:hypothetical protein
MIVIALNADTISACCVDGSIGSPRLHHKEWHFHQNIEDSAQLAPMDNPQGELDHGFH